MELKFFLYANFDKYGMNLKRGSLKELKSDMKLPCMFLEQPYLYLPLRHHIEI